MTEVPTHEAKIPYFGLINIAMERGFDHMFGKVPNRVEGYRRICETLRYLEVNVLAGQSMSDIIHQFSPNYERWDQNRQVTRDELKKQSVDSAFRLIYQFLVGDLESRVDATDLPFHGTFYVCSHHSPFNNLIHKIVKAVYRERFQVSPKQLEKLNGLPPGPGLPQ